MDEKAPKAADTDEVRLNDILLTHGDIHRVVDDFYTRIQRDPILQVPFRSVHDWPEHIERLTHFWWIKFGGKPYLFSHYNPVMKHYFAGFNDELLTRWLRIFSETLDTHLSPEQSTLWRTISQKMGQGLSQKNEMLKEEARRIRKSTDDETTD